MSAEVKKEIQLEIAHVLFIDIVGYSKLSINEQHAAVEELNEVVRASEQFQRGEAAGRLLKIATGDGMALVFYTSPEAPAHSAVEISRAVKEHPRLQLRMGIHSGPVSGVIDVNNRPNLAGAGLNMAQRVMDCGDAGHILLSKHVAEDLEEYDYWRSLLHELGACEVKHGMRVSIVSLYADQVGNPQLPKKFQALKKHSARVRWATMTAALLALAVIVAAITMFSHYRVRSMLAAPEKSIAVLPFENLSANAENAFFTDGVQDEILANLAKIADLKVISRTSVMLYKSGNPRNLREVGQQLGVANVVEGSVQRAGNNVRVMAQLIDARTDAHLWAATYDRDLADVFAIQSEIAQKIADQLQAKLSAKEKSAISERPTSDFAAYDLFLRAKELFYDGDLNPSRLRDDLFKAVQLLDQALARDPAFLLAHCRLAYAHDLTYWIDYDHTETRLALAETNVRAAVRLQPDSGETHLAQAIHFYWGYRNFDRAREELAKAQHALPNNVEIFMFLGLIDRRQGCWDEAIRNFERAVDLDPRNVERIWRVGQIYSSDLRRYRDAIAMANRALALEPRSAFLRALPALIGVEADANMAPLHATLKAIEAERPALAAEVANISFQLALRERDPVAAAHALANIPSEGKGTTYSSDIPFPHAWFEGLLAKLRQDASSAHSAFKAARAETEKLVRAQPGNATPLSVLALIDAELGEKEKAIEEGRIACDMIPVARDAVDGVGLVTNLACIYALTGEKDLALKQLEIVSKIPCGPSYGELRLDLEWDALRGDPRFEKIVASLAPKAADK
jgi:TolB-like protein/class 3 adenylate cyclase/Tfp pilus assembly protein PilF